MSLLQCGDGGQTMAEQGMKTAVTVAKEPEKVRLWAGGVPAVDDCVFHLYRPRLPHRAQHLRTNMCVQNNSAR